MRISGNSRGLQWSDYHWKRHCTTQESLRTHWNEDSPVSTNEQWFPMVSKWCRTMSSDAQWIYFRGGKKRTGICFFWLVDFQGETTNPKKGNKGTTGQLGRWMDQILDLGSHWDNWISSSQIAELPEHVPSTHDANMAINFKKGPFGGHHFSVGIHVHQLLFRLFPIKIY